MDPEVRALTGDAELEQAWELERRAFDAPSEDRERWIGLRQPGRTLGVFVDGALAAMASIGAGGQFYGGRAVPVGRVASVAVAPEHRGRGYGSLVVSSCLPAMRAQGEVVSALFPATTRLYRGLGWEVAGAHVQRAVPCRSLNLLPTGTADLLRRAGREDLGAIQDAYVRVARNLNGFLDRPEEYWEARLGSRWDQLHVYVADADDDSLGSGGSGPVDGYVVYRHTRPRREGFGIHVEELVASHADAAVALWRLVGSSAAQVAEVTFQGAPEDPLLLLLPEQDITTRWELRWMLRLVDAAGAVAARGFPPGVDVTVDLAVRDRHCPWNDGRWRLVVGDGRGRLEPGGTGDVRVGVGPLAALYSGWCSAATLARSGLLSGASERHLQTLDAAFAGPTPWMPDFF